MCQLGIFNTNPMHMLYKVTVMAHTSGSVTHSKKPDFTCFYLLAAMKGTFGYHEHNERITVATKLHCKLYTLGAVCLAQKVCHTI